MFCVQWTNHFICEPCLQYSTEHSTGDALHEIGEKARSTAEEFTRKAQEKKESIKESAQDVLETAKDAALRDTQADKERVKEKVEKGNYDKIGRDWGMPHV